MPRPQCLIDAPSLGNMSEGGRGKGDQTREGKGAQRGAGGWEQKEEAWQSRFKAPCRDAGQKPSVKVTHVALMPVGWPRHELRLTPWVLRAPAGDGTGGTSDQQEVGAQLTEAASCCAVCGPPLGVEWEIKASRLLPSCSPEACALGPVCLLWRRTHRQAP